MNTLSASTGRKKVRASNIGKQPSSSRLRSSLSHPSHQRVSLLAAHQDDGGAVAPSDAPYVCTGRFGVDFVQLCRRAHLIYIPNVVPRPHRPSAALFGDDVRNTKPSHKLPLSSQIAASHVADQTLVADTAEGFMPEPPPKTYVLRDAISFFRPSVQVSPFSSL